MDNLYFNDYEDFACDVADKYESIKDDEYNDIAVVAKYEEARRLIKELLCIGYDLHSIEMHDDEWDGYDSEYIVSLYDNEIWCEPMKRENGYITDDSPVIYILNNCSSKVISYCEGNNVYEVSISDDSDEEHDYTVNGKHVDKETFDEYVSKFAPDKVKKSEDNPTSTAIYRINGKNVSKEEYNKAVSEIEDKYIDNMRDMLLRYAEFMDEMNEWRKLLYW